MKQPHQKVYSGVWITLAAVAASIAFFYLPLLSFPLSFIALVAGYRSLKVIHKYPELFTGSWILIPTLIITVLAVLINAAGLTLFLFIPEQKGEKINIATDEDAIAFANELRIDIAEQKLELAQPFDGALVMTLNRDEMNALGLANPELFDANETFYLVSWEMESESLIKVCSTAFTTTGNVALEPGCAVTEIGVEEENEIELESS